MEGRMMQEHIMSATTPLVGKSCISTMMERLGIEPGGAAVPRLGLRYATAFRQCRSCPSTPACREWLAQAPSHASLPPRFCPNFDILFELQFDAPGSGRGDPLGVRVDERRSDC
jgi:hypothetical protein